MFIVKDEHEKTKADIRIIGVGGAGNNMIETMIKANIKGVDFIAINTDHQALEASSASKKIQIGSKLTKGLGAGANPEVGRRASVESYEEIVNCLKGADMVFITAGMGGGTGTGAAPFIAQSAQELGILTVGIVTKPFLFEGHKRSKQAKKGVNELSQYVDTLIVVPNEKLLSLAEKNTPLLETFKLTDEVLLQAVKGISELVSVPGLINLDFADIKTVMQNKGMALMGRGSHSGPNRVEKALKTAVSSPLLGGLSIKGATGIIVNVTGDSSLSLLEFQQASSFITDMADPSADIIVGTVIDENMADQISITVIATGFAETSPHEETKSHQKALNENSNEKAILERNKTLKEAKENISEKQMFQKSSLEKLRENQDSQAEQSSQEDPIQGKSSQSESSETHKPKDMSLSSTQEKTEQADSLQEEVNLQKKETLMRESVIQKQNNLDFIEKKNPLSIQEQEENKITNFNEESFQNEKGIEKPKDSNLELSKQNPENKKPSLREILLSKSKEYKQSQERQNNSSSDIQIDMNLKENHEELSSPFEANIEFSDQDLR